MDPNIWGPSAWFFLHSVSFTYPQNPSEEDKTNYLTFFNSLQNILPCYKCSQNYKKHIEQYPIETALNSRDTMVNWLIKIHNEVNKELYKPILTYDQVLSEFKKQVWSIKYNELTIYRIIIVILLIFFIYKYSTKQLKI